MRPTPARFVERLLAAAVGDADRADMILGDLHEEFVRRAARSTSRAHVWHAAQALRLAIRMTCLDRVRARRPFHDHQKGDTLMTSVLADLRYGFRSLRKRPGMTAVVAITLALGVGANATIFNVLDRLVLRPFPFDDPDRIVMLSETGPGIEYKKEAVSPANFLDWRRGADTIVHLTAMQWWDANLLDRGDPERVPGFQVSPGFFEALGMSPALGRGFVRDDETFGRHRVVVLGNTLWKRRFAADPGIVGRRITIDGEPYEVVGVASPRFAFPEGAELWAPLAFDPAKPVTRRSRYLTVIGRLAPGRTINDAAAQMDVMAARLAREYPDDNRDHGVATDTLTAGMMDVGLGPMLGLWQTSALIVLLIAAANIANLQLARATERRREIGVRMALGAARGRVLRELFTESLLLSVASVPFALAFAWLALYVIRIGMPAAIVRFVPGWESLGPDPRLLAFTIVVAVAAACLFGILPAAQASRSRVTDVLKDGGRTATGRHRLRRAIVVAEVALALPLLAAAGLSALGSYRIMNGPQGYDPSGVLTMKLVLPERRYPDEQSRRSFAARALEAIDGVGGVEHAAAINKLPAGGSTASRVIEIDGHPAPDPNNPPAVEYRLVTPALFGVLRIPIVRGRAFGAADREDGAPVAIVSESMAQRFWPGEDPIGRRVRVRNGQWMTVVGVCGDLIQDWFAARNEPTLYRPMAQSPTDSFGIVVRAAGDPSAIAGGVRQALLRVDPTQPVFDLKTMRRQLHERTIGLQYLTWIMAVFAVLSLLLAAVGLYAVMAYTVAQRRQEIGIRIALGASARHVVRHTVGQAIRLAGTGVAIGFVLSVLVGRLMEAGLLGVASSDARVFLAFAGVLMLSALGAAYVPARRAAATDPIAALRE
ncbi:MAG TPA: ABC transporter permease [Vicinamibacterales bacterium]|nr:ABC transporter permease [Vicinamibacterales bacterium]